MAVPRKRAARHWRQGILFTTGLVGLFYETVIDKHRSADLVLAFLTMLGLPVFDVFGGGVKRGDDTEDPSR